MPIIICKNCGIEVDAWPYEIGRKSFCSRKCNCSYNMKGHKHAVGNKNWLGKKHTEKSKEKNRIAHIGKRKSIGTEFKKNSSPWNKGKPFLQIAGNSHPAKRLEVALSISKAKIGKANHLIRGEKNNRWRGGITKENNKIRSSIEYKQWRRSVFERDGFTCQCCGQVGGKLHADHIKQFAFFPELRLDINNGRTLCEPCHKKTPTFNNSKKSKAA